MLDALRDSIAAYTAALKAFVLARTSIIPVIEQITLAPDATQTYDLPTLIGAEHTQYDKLAANVTVRVLDTEVGSPTENLYINAETMVRTAVDAQGTVMIHNRHDTSLDCYIRVKVPPVTS